MHPANPHPSRRGGTVRAILGRVFANHELVDRRHSLASLSALASSLGVSRVIEQPLQNGPDGIVDAMLIPANNGFVIALNENVSESRRRYSLAHEIGHLVIQKAEDNGGDGEPNHRFRKARYDHSDQQEERLCQAIAAELLMPAASFTESLDHLGYSLKNIPALAQEFASSITSTAIRYKELMPEPCLLVRWHSSSRLRGALSPSWSLCNEAPGPRVEVASAGRTRSPLAFSGAEDAWSAASMKTTYEKLLERGSSRNRSYLRFPEFRTESMGFGKEKSRFVLSAVYLSDERPPTGHSPD